MSSAKSTANTVGPNRRIARQQAVRTKCGDATLPNVEVENSMAELAEAGGWDGLKNSLILTDFQLDC